MEVAGVGGGIPSYSLAGQPLGRLLLTIIISDKRKKHLLINSK
jgi:hypothetical protein